MISRKALEEELKSLEQPDDNMQPLITRDVLNIYDAICKVADESGHSGASFNYMMGLVNQLIIKGKLIRPIKDIDEDPDDWADITERSAGSRRDKIEKLYQNKRRPSVFCEVENGGFKKYYDIDNCAVTDSNGNMWYGTNRYRQFENITVPYSPDGKVWKIYEEPSNEGTDSYAVIKKIERS